MRRRFSALTQNVRPLVPVAGAVTVAAMIATPLAPARGPTRRALSSVVVSSLFAATTARSATRWGPRRAVGAAATVAAATTIVEGVGTRTGFPFGRYHYTGALRPRVGGVPVIVPLAWFAMAVPARETAHAALGPRSTPARRVVVGSAALTAWDLFLDPQMVAEGYWRWARRGAYRGIPLTNYLGWFVTGLGVMTVLELVLPADAPERPRDLRPDAVLVGGYSYMAVMETLGFAAFFRDRTVAAVGGAAMLPVAGAAVRQLWSWRRWRTVTPR